MDAEDIGVAADDAAGVCDTPIDPSPWAPITQPEVLTEEGDATDAADTEVAICAVELN